jgi:hypothetical protein
VRTTSIPDSTPKHPSKAHHDGSQVVAQPRAATEDRAHRVDRDGQPGLLHPPDDEAATGGVLVREGLAVDAGEARRLVVVRADRREFHEIRPEAIAVDREDGWGEGGGVGGVGVHGWPFE